jgi:hypothetical protein
MAAPARHPLQFQTVSSIIGTSMIQLPIRSRKRHRFDVYTMNWAISGSLFSQRSAAL